MYSSYIFLSGAHLKGRSSWCHLASCDFCSAQQLFRLLSRYVDNMEGHEATSNTSCLDGSMSVRFQTSVALILVWGPAM